jgi:hypothetical protein
VLGQMASRDSRSLMARFARWGSRPVSSLGGDADSLIFEGG